MPSTSLNIRISLRDLPLDEKLDCPVSIAIMPDGEQIIVSRYCDDIWDFWPYVPHENKDNSGKRIDWSVNLGDGRRLTDQENAALLRSCKDFVWSCFTEPVEGRKRPRIGTIVKFSQGPMKIFLRWMIGMGYTQFHQIDGNTMGYVPHARSGVSTTTARERLALLEKLYLQREKLSDALQRHPWPFDTAANLSGASSSPDKYKPKTPIIPDQVLKKLGSIAIDYVENRAKKILDVRDHLADCGYEVVYIPEIQSMQRRVTLLAQECGYLTARDHSRDVINLKTACYIVIAMFSGIRDSELLSLSTNCITHDLSHDGIELIWLHGTIYKTGIRPKRWGVPPIVEVAIEVMKRLSAPLRASLLSDEKKLISLHTRTNAQAKRLQTVLHQKDKLFLGLGIGGSGKEIIVTCNSGSGHHLRQFCKRHDIIGKDGNFWPLSPHQFRRTFAYNYAKNQMGDLLNLKEHFGHIALDMTLLYADRGADEYEADKDLISMIADAKHDHHIKILTNLVESDSPISNGSKWVGEWRRTIRTSPNKEQLIEDLADTLSLTGTGHSWCAGSAKGTGCGSRCLFEPDMCVDCHWAIISEEHLPVWKEIARQQESVIACEDIGTLGKVRAKQILAKARETITKLEKDVTHAED